MEIGALIHFNMATTGGCSKDAATFNPTKLDTVRRGEGRGGGEEEERNKITEMRGG